MSETSGNFIRQTNGQPLTSWNSITGSGSSIVNTTYNVIGIGWGNAFTYYLPLIRR